MPMVQRHHAKGMKVDARCQIDDRDVAAALPRREPHPAMCVRLAANSERLQGRLART